MIDPRIQSFAPSADHLLLSKDIAAWRRNNDDIGRQRGGKLPKVASVSLARIPTRDGACISAQVYDPRADKTQPCPVYVYVHGGGWVVGSCDGSDYVTRALAQESLAVVVSIDYRMAPEVTYPVPLNDVSDTLGWIRDEAANNAWDTKRIVLAGDSAGAHLAITAALRDLRAGKGVAAILAIYPCLDPVCKSVSMRSFAVDHALTQAGMRWYWEQYLGKHINTMNGDISPWFESSLAGMPPTWIVTAQYDPLRDEAETFAHRLRDAGVLVGLERQPGMLHGFIRWRGVVPHASKALKAGVHWVSLQLESAP